VSASKIVTPRPRSTKRSELTSAGIDAPPVVTAWVSSDPLNIQLLGTSTMNSRSNSETLSATASPPAGEVRVNATDAFPTPDTTFAPMLEAWLATPCTVAVKPLAAENAVACGSTVAAKSPKPAATSLSRPRAHRHLTAQGPYSHPRRG
jgi:hypothetical protein